MDKRVWNWDRRRSLSFWGEDGQEAGGGVIGLLPTGDESTNGDANGLRMGMRMGMRMGLGLALLVGEGVGLGANSAMRTCLQ